MPDNKKRKGDQQEEKQENNKKNKPEDEENDESDEDDNNDAYSEAAKESFFKALKHFGALDSQTNNEDEEREDEDEGEGEEGDDDEEEFDGQFPLDFEDENEPATEAEKQFMEELNEQESISGKTVFLLDQWTPTTDIDSPTLEELRALPRILIPTEASDNIAHILEALDTVTGGLMVMNTASSHQLVKEYYKEIQKVHNLFAESKFSAAFSGVFAVTQAMKQIEHWYHDTDVPEEVNKLMTELKKAWDTVLKKTDDELGFGGENARNELINHLKDFGQEVKEFDQSYDFVWF